MKAVIAVYARSSFHFAKKGALAEVRPDTLATQCIGGGQGVAAILEAL
jgi:acetyl-CoA acyltransferase